MLEARDTDFEAITINGEIYTRNSLGDYVIGTQTLVPGGPAITVMNTPLSLFPSATAILINGKPTPLTTAAPAITPAAEVQTAEAPFTFHGSVFKTNSYGDYVCGTQTLIPGGPPITIDNTPVSLFPSATALLINGQPTPLSAAPAVAPATTPAPKAKSVESPFTFHGSIFTTNAYGDYACGTKTLIPGGPAITIDNTPVSLFPSATALLINGRPTPLSAAPAVAPATTPAPKAKNIGSPFTFHGSVFTTNVYGDYACGTKTLIPGGPAITIDNTPVSLFPSATAVLIGSQATPL